jgi:hypothetical protein
MSDFFDYGEDPVKVRRRIHTQGLNILRAIIEAYNTGLLEDPRHTKTFCTTLALIAEGKVEGHFDEELGLTRWETTDNEFERLSKIREMILGSKIVKGPWEKSVDTELE